MKYFALVLILISTLAASAAELPSTVGNDIFTLIGNDPQITIVYGYRNDENLRYFGIRDITCTKSPTVECAMESTPPNENVSPVQLRGSSAEKLIAILARLQPGALSHKGFDCSYSEKSQQTNCRFY